MSKLRKVINDVGNCVLLGILLRFELLHIYKRNKELSWETSFWGLRSFCVGFFFVLYLSLNFCKKWRCPQWSTKEVFINFYIT